MKHNLNLYFRVETRRTLIAVRNTDLKTYDKIWKKGASQGELNEDELFNFP